MSYNRATMSTDLYEQARQHIKEGDLATATDELEQVTRLQPGNWRAFSHLGYAYAQTAKLEKAIGAFKRAVEINPGAANLRYNLGQAYELAGVPLEATYEYEEALRLDSGYQLAREALEQLHLRSRHDEEA